MDNFVGVVVKVLVVIGTYELTMWLFSYFMGVWRMKKKDKIVRTNITIPEWQYEYLRKWAYENKSSASYLIRYLINYAQKLIPTKEYIEQDYYNEAIKETKKVDTPNSIKL